MQPLTAGQYQYLADKYAPAEPEISETLAKLQLPPDLDHPSLTKTSFVPLPRRGRAQNTQHHIALLIREGRRAAQQLSAAADASGTGSSKETATVTTMTTLSTMLEQDFTVEGRKGPLGCPFTAVALPSPDETLLDDADAARDTTPHRSSDPICAAMFEEATAHPAPDKGTPAKCPIRFLDQHSPEEIAHYVEKHKHQIPRSHEVCVRRYQKNEDQIRKLDAKYGNLVSMIQDLSQLHKPMLPAGGEEAHRDGDGASNERVETWANQVTTDGGDPEAIEADETADEDDQDREGHFARPLKEVRLGESPSRPWGISVPAFDALSRSQDENDRPTSPPPAPVLMPSPELPGISKASGAVPAQCPFHHHGRFSGAHPPSSPAKETSSSGTVEEQPIRLSGSGVPLLPPSARSTLSSYQSPRNVNPLSPTSPVSPSPTGPAGDARPAFLNPDLTSPGQLPSQEGRPQMLFTGPVFIGYPIEQAIQFMQHFQQTK